MNRYILRRIIQALPVILGITLVTFTFIELAPGDAVMAMILADMQSGGRVVQIDVEAMRKQLGLDQPAPVRYVRWLGEMLQGNMGVRLRSKIPVATEIAQRLPATLELMGFALLIAIVVGIPLGVISAVRQYSWLDYLLTTGTFVGVAVPSFFAAIAAIYIFSLKLGWFPTSGYSTPGQNFGLLGWLFNHVQYLIMPATILGLESIAGISRYMRASMLEVLRLDYVTTARAKGLRGRAIVTRHVLRNAALPIVTIVGLSLGNLLSGAVIVETIFAWPGMGRLAFSAAIQRDYPTVLGTVMFFSVLTIMGNLLSDIFYGIVDPRVRLA